MLQTIGPSSEWRNGWAADETEGEEYVLNIGTREK